MQLTVISATPNPLHVISEAAGICYGKSDYSPKRVQRCIANGHMSVVEHAAASIRIEGISRACLAQLTRHRMASFSVKSQRYCRIGSDDWYVEPPRVTGDPLLNDAFLSCMNYCVGCYEFMLANGAKHEDARFILPEATKTECILTMNARSLDNFLRLRMDKAAQWEIRQLAASIQSSLREVDEEWMALMDMLEEARKNE